MIRLVCVAPPRALPRLPPASLGVSARLVILRTTSYHMSFHIAPLPLLSRLLNLLFQSSSSVNSSRWLLSRSFTSTSILHFSSANDKPSTSSKSTSSTSTNNTKVTTTEEPKHSPSFRQEPWEWLKTLPGTIWHGIVYTWIGFKLFGLNIRTACSLLFRMTRGHNLSRREHRLLVTTASDLFRMVPFSFFVIVPMAEFLLPVALKLFPNMLPSTFDTEKQRETKLQRELKARIDLAKFVKDTVQYYKDTRSMNDSDIKKFDEFMEMINQGQEIGGPEVYKFVAKFRDDITLESLKRSQLQQMCKFLNIVPFGPTQLLRFQLQNRVQKLKADDRMIREEGLSSLSLVELKQACAARGMNSLVSRQKLEQLLEEWLDLSLNQKVPTALLILSRAFRLMSEMPAHPTEELIKTIKHLPEEIIDDVETDVELTTKDFRQKYELLKEERALVKQEETEDALLRQQLPELNVGSVEQLRESEMKVASIGNLLTGMTVPCEDEKETIEIIQQEIHELRKEPLPPEVLKIEQRLEKMVNSIGESIKKASQESKPLLDLDHDGKFTTEELYNFLVKQRGLKESEVKTFVDKLDQDKDGYVDYEHVKKLRTLDINIDSFHSQSDLDEEGTKKRAELYKKLKNW